MATLKSYPDKHPQLAPSISTLQTLDLEDSPVTSVSEAPYRVLVAVIGGVALGARLKGCASTSYGTIAGVLQLYGKYVDTTLSLIECPYVYLDEHYLTPTGTVNAVSQAMHKSAHPPP